VCEHTAQILGHDSATQVRPGKPFHEQGVSSLGVVELRNRLSALTGFRVPASALFDHPTPTALAAYLDTELAPAPEPALPEPTIDLDDVLSQAEREIYLAAEDLLDG
jgi:acyl carrier protein